LNNKYIRFLEIRVSTKHHLGKSEVEEQAEWALRILRHFFRYISGDYRAICRHWANQWEREG